jgi:hypothetical protein
MAQDEKMDPSEFTPIQPATMSQAEVNQRFYCIFQQQSTELREEIDQIDSYSTIAGERQDAIDHANYGLTQLSDKVTDAIPFVPAYDQRIYQQVS